MRPSRAIDDIGSASADQIMEITPAEPTGASSRPTWVMTWVILLMLVAGCALTILVFQPGYMTVDARYVYDDSRSWNFNDWQSPVMGLLWWFIDPVAPGAWSMFLLMAMLYWLGFGVLALTIARRSTWLGISTLLLALAPPAFFFAGMIWRDVLFGVA